MIRWNFFLVVVVICLCGFLVRAQSSEILIVSDEWPQMDVLATFLHEEGGYEIHKKEQKQMPESLNGYEAVIQFIHGMLYDEPAAKLMNYTKNGGRLLVLHHGVSSKKKQTKGWYEFLGMELDRSDNAEHYYEWIHDVDYTLVNLHPNHYITSHKIEYPKTQSYAIADQPSPKREFPAMTFEGSEVFINHQFTDGREKTVLFGFHFKNPKDGKLYMQDRGGWYIQNGEGYVIYFQPGHLVDDFKDPYCQIILNAIQWKP